jgi:hypothetical protein
VKLTLRKKKKRIPEGPNVLNAQVLGIFELIVGTSRKARERLTMWLLVTSQRKKKLLSLKNFLAFVAPHVEEEDSYYSKHSDNGEELKEAYKTLYIEYERLREGRKQHLYDLNSLQTEKSSLLLRIQELEEKLLETQLQLERVTDEKLTPMLSIQKSPTDKTGLGYVAPSSDAPSTSKTVFVKPAVPEPPPIAEDKGKDKINDDILGTQKPHSIKISLICHHCSLSGHVRLSAPSWKLRKPRPRKKCPDRPIMALDLWPSFRLHGIQFLGIKHLDIKHLGLIHHDTRHLSISGLNSDLYQPITVATSRTNPSSLEGLRRWKKINITVSHLSGCRAWWSGWCLASNHPLEGRLGSRRMVTPWGGTDAPSKFRCSCLGFGS